MKNEKRGVKAPLNSYYLQDKDNPKNHIVKSFSGTYLKSGKELIKNNIKILLKTRKHITKEKPLYYLYMIKPYNAYISSLYPKKQGYIIEYQGVYYRFIDKGDKVIMEVYNG